MSMLLSTLPLELVSTLILDLPTARGVRSLLLSCRAFQSLWRDPALQAHWLLAWRPQDALHLAAALDLGPLVRELLVARPESENQASVVCASLGLRAAGSLTRHLAQDGTTALHLACAHGHAGAQAALLAAPGIDVNARDARRSWTALHVLACRAHGNDDGGLLQSLLAHPRLEINLQTPLGSTALHLAAKSGALVATRMLLRAKGILVNQVDSDGETPLHKASLAGHSAVVAALCEPAAAAAAAAAAGLMATNDAGVDVNRRSATNGSTALHLASQEGHALAVEALLASPAVLPERTDHSGCTALHLAARAGHLGVARVLLTPRQLPSANTASVNARDACGLTPLHQACISGQADMVQLLAGCCGADVNAADNYGEVALHKACTRGWDRIVQLLASFPGTDVNAADEVGITPLHTACKSGHTGAVKALLAAPGLDPWREDAAGDTAIHRAVANEGVLAALLRRLPSAVFGQRGANGRTPLHAACLSGQLGSTEMLLAALPAGAVKEVDNAGQAPLHLACAGGHVAVAELLCDAKGVSVDVCDAEGSTPAQHAARSVHAAALLEVLSMCC